MLNGLDLFSGIGGLTAALEPWVRPVAYCERDRYCQAVLLSRQASFHIRPAPIWDDVCTLTSGVIGGDIDIIYGGFPCQDISQAGSGGGLGGERSGLYWELHRVVKEVGPTWVFLENVPAIRTRGLLTVVRSLTDLGYDCRWTCVSAAEVGAPHLRKRWFLLGYSDDKGKSVVSLDDEVAELQESPANTGGSGLEEQCKQPSRQEQPTFERGDWRSFESPVCGGDDVVPNRVDRIRGLGNAVVPSQAREAFKRLMGLSDEV